MAEFQKILKANPYHDSQGKFTSRSQAAARNTQNADAIGLVPAADFGSGSAKARDAHLDKAAEAAVRRTMSKDSFLEAVDSRGYSNAASDKAGGRYDFHKKNQAAIVAELTQHRGNPLYLD